MFNNLDQRKLGVNLNAPIASSEKDQIPVVIFSHGLSAHKHIYSTFLKEWTSNGYMVIAIDHDEQVYFPIKDEFDFIEKRKPQLKDRRDAMTRVLDLFTRNKIFKSFSRTIKSI